MVTGCRQQAGRGVAEGVLVGGKCSVTEADDYTIEGFEMRDEAQETGWQREEIRPRNKVIATLSTRKRATGP